VTFSVEWSARLSGERLVQIPVEQIPDDFGEQKV
jgi:hypothetical protein